MKRTLMLVAALSLSLAGSQASARGSSPGSSPHAVGSARSSQSFHIQPIPGVPSWARDIDQAARARVEAMISATSGGQACIPAVAMARGSDFFQHATVISGAALEKLNFGDAWDGLSEAAAYAAELTGVALDYTRSGARDVLADGQDDSGDMAAAYQDYLPTARDMQLDIIYYYLFVFPVSSLGPDGMIAFYASTFNELAAYYAEDTAIVDAGQCAVPVP